MARLLADLAGQKNQLIAEQERLELAIEVAHSERDDLQKAKKRFLQYKEEELSSEFRLALEELKTARRNLDQAKTLLKKPNAQRMSHAQRQIDQAGSTIIRHEPKRAFEGQPASVDQLVPGTDVIVPSLGGQGIVLEMAQRGKVAVRVGSLRSLVAVEEVLLSSDKKHHKTAITKPLTKPSNTTQHALTVRTAGNTTDVRGMRVDEATSIVDKALDNAMLCGEEALFVIHGHGTGALRSAIRELLQDHQSVKRFEAADVKEGGQGVTIVYLA